MRYTRGLSTTSETALRATGATSSTTGNAQHHAIRNARSHLDTKSGTGPRFTSVNIADMMKAMNSDMKNAKMIPLNFAGIFMAYFNVAATTAWSALRFIVWILVCLSSAIAAAAEPYPAKPIRIVLGFPPGGATDILSRDFAARLGDELKQQVIIENKPGAGGTIGADYVAKAAPDGYVLTIGTSSNHAIAVSLYKKLPYDPVKDFSPITILAVSQNVVVVNQDIPAKNIKELVAYAKANPGKLNFGSSGNGTISHLTGEMFNALNDTQIAHIPYKGSAFVFPDLISGQISMMFDSTISISPLLKSGKARALAVTGATRSKLMPELPTVAESGYAGFQSTNWFGLFAPAGTPKEIVGKLNTAAVKVLSSHELQERFANQGAEIIANKPEEAAAMLKSDIGKWADVARKSGAKID